MNLHKIIKEKTELEKKQQVRRNNQKHEVKLNKTTITGSTEQFAYIREDREKERKNILHLPRTYLYPRKNV